jgi:L-rhamnose isomerase
MASTYQFARERYMAKAIDTESVIDQLSSISLSIHCWQGDDVGGFEGAGSALNSSGLQSTGNYPGKPRTIPEFRQDFCQALTLIPGRHRIALHALYADLEGRKVDRSEYSCREFQSWIDWCSQEKIGMDFNPTFFAHPKAADGNTLSHRDPAIRNYWIEHGIACRNIAAEAGRQLTSPVINNFWIPDGMKDTPADRKAPRERLTESLDRIFQTGLDPSETRDSLESKLFGIGSESFVVGSHEFYLGYAITRKKMLCLDSGHFHPTEGLADKISSVLLYVPELLLHISRGIRWDSDHVVLFDDATRSIAEEVARGNEWDRVHFGLDYFDASINRVAAWAIGARNTLKAILYSLLQPMEESRTLEQAGDYTARLALMEDSKTLPFGEVWEEFCLRHNTPGDGRWLDEIRRYESTVLAGRD